MVAFLTKSTVLHNLMFKIYNYKYMLLLSYLQSLLLSHSTVYLHTLSLLIQVWMKTKPCIVFKFQYTIIIMIIFTNDDNYYH